MDLTENYNTCLDWFIYLCSQAIYRTAHIKKWIRIYLKFSLAKLQIYSGKIPNSKSARPNQREFQKTVNI